MRVADYVFEFIATQGVRDCFLLPGGGAMHLVDALGRNDKLDYIPMHHEQAAAIAAEAYSRVSENIGVALVTTGPGGLNALTAVGGAWIESVPLLIVSGQVKRADLVGDSGVRQMGAQEIDIVSVVAPLTKYAVTLKDPEDIRYHLEKAVHLARSGRQGPVWLDIPLDIQAAHVNPEELTGYTPEVSGAAEGLPTAQVRKLLASSRRPLLLAGHGIRLAGATEVFRQLYRQLQIPVVTTWNAADLIPYDDPLCVGRPGSVALRAPNFAIQNCDLLISIGARLDNVVTAYNTPGFARAAKKLVVDIDPAELAKLQMDNLLSVTADAGDFIRALLQDMPGTGDWSDWLSHCADTKKRYPVCDGQPFPDKSEISHYQFVVELADALPADQLIVTGSSGLAVEVFYTAFANKPGQRLFLTSGLGAMGYGLPAAIGACISNGRKPMVAVESDGSLQLNLQELSTLVGQELPIRLFVMNNRGYASIRNTQRNYFDGRYVGTGPEAGLHMPDLCRLAEAIGLPTLQIREAVNLRDGIRQVLAHPGPILCDIGLVHNEQLWPKVSAIPHADGSITSMPLEDMSPLLPIEQLEREMFIPLLPASMKSREKEQGT